jgi:hypothetical protein
MISHCIHAAGSGGERQVVPTPKSEASPTTEALSSSLSSLAARLGLSFWGHHADHADFIVVRREAINTEGAAR